MQGVGGDRWQPPDLPNKGEVLHRPQAEEEDQATYQQDQQAQPLEEAKSVAAPVDVRVEPLEPLVDVDQGASQRSGHPAEFCSSFHLVTDIVVRKYLEPCAINCTYVMTSHNGALHSQKN